MTMRSAIKTSRRANVPRHLMIRSGRIEATAALNESTTAGAILRALPLRGHVQRWGEEIYFSIPVEVGLEDGAREQMGVGEIAYWPMGKAFCIFFGPTPASVADEPRAYSPVNPIGHIQGDASVFAELHGGEEIVLEVVED
jgi:hypothetical protein